MIGIYRQIVNIIIHIFAQMFYVTNTMVKKLRKFVFGGG
jgi:hypothetical protein